MEELKERIKYVREAFKIGSQDKMATLLNVNNARVKSLETGRVKELTAMEANIIVKKFNLNIDWLLTGNGNILLTENESTEPPTNLVSITYFKDTYAAAGAGALNYDDAPIVMAFEKEFLREKLGISSFKHLHIINAIGDSMYPTIQTGELLFVNPFENESTLIRDTDIYVINTVSGVLVKRIKVIDPINRKYALVSDNPKHEDIPLTGDDLESCKILGRVVGHFNKL
jgi:phage repressor protein C with HTH and peptisase S24 domain